jgi:hypothetical protein
MLASRFEAATLSTNMADDTMEISSENGYNMGDEDIDIDIDFTAGHVDEDYVLEDAASNVGFGDDFQPQPSPAVAHDDLMIDEDDESFPMPMDGADFMQDEDSHNIGPEPLDVSFTPDIPIVLVDGNSLEDTSHVVAAGEMKESEVTWETNEEPEQGQEQESHEAEVHLEDLEEEHHDTHEEPGDAQHSANIKDAEAPASPPHEDSLSNSPHNICPEGSTIGEEPGSPSVSISAPALDSQDHGTEHSDAALGTSPISQDVVSTIETATAEDVTSAPSIQEVVVVYRDSEYSLFSKSETDDIDSYFLSDLSLKEKPLVNFFAAIRDVICDDLKDEDELCLSVEDLGLEVEEVSCLSVHWQQSSLTFAGQMSSLMGGFTIGQIINLHEKLMKNDGVETVRPLCLALGTRPNFSIRFANLSLGALEGKGLSELISWDEHSESFDESAHVTDNEHGEELEADSYEADEVAEEEKSDLPQQEGSDDTLAHEPAGKQEALEEAAGTEKGDASGATASNGTHAFNESIAQPTPVEDVLPFQNSEAADSGEYDEDGDLIDYSDAEEEARPELRKDAKSHATKLKPDDNRTYNGTFTDFIPPCLKPNTCFCSKCNDLLLAEYEAINEELRRRSISRTAEDNLLEHAAETNEGGDHDHETNLETEENGIDYDENEGDILEPSNLAAKPGDQSADFGEEDVVKFDSHEDEFFIEDSDADGGEILEVHGPTSETIVGAGQETFDEFDFGDDDTQQHQKLPGFADQEAKSYDEHNDNNPTNKQTAASTKEIFSVGNSRGFADVADSESAASERTLEAQPISVDDLQTEIKEHNEDEIDYDDDEEEELDAGDAQEPDVKELETPHSDLRKRQRTEDDGTSTGSKGMYKSGIVRMKIY